MVFDIKLAALEVIVVPVTPFMQNSSIVFHKLTKRGAVIDPGGEVPRLLKTIKEYRVTIERIVITHGHIDHMGGANALQEALQSATKADVPIEGPHQDDEVLIRDLVGIGKLYGITDVQNPIVNRWLKEGDEVDIGGIIFKTMHCPGHSPGSVVFYNEIERFALMGDVLFAGSIGRTDIPLGNHRQLMQSIDTKIMTLPNDVVFLPGHGHPSKISIERQKNPFLRSKY